MNKTQPILLLIALAFVALAVNASEFPGAYLYEYSSFQRTLALAPADGEGSGGGGNVTDNTMAEAKKKALAILFKLGWANISLPWIAQEIQDTRKLMGDNTWPYGIKANEKTLNALFQYSHEQGLASRRLKIEEAFHPATLELNEA